MSRIGVVAIGRNEGERLRKCVQSLDPRAVPVVYVDSGSTDGSSDMARSLGATVVDLDLTVPFTAARARNAGFDILLTQSPNVEFVQFVDGDCEIVGGWLERAEKYLTENPSVTVVCGRRRERHPEISIYNRLCDIEWNTPVGEAKASGGDAMMRVEIVRNIGGYNPDIIAGEDEEIGVRIRQAGGKIMRLDAEMAIHDAAMTRFRQWWRRATRAGYAYSLGYFMHGRPPERHYARERRRILTWGFFVPIVAVGAAWPTMGLSLLLLLFYPFQVFRIFRRTRRQKVPGGDALAFGVSCTLSKFPEFMGFCKFQIGRLRRQRARIIEYK